MGGFRIEGEEMPDLPIIGPGGLRIFDEVAVDAGLWALFNSAKKYWRLFSFQYIHALSLVWTRLGPRSRRCWEGSPKALATRLKQANSAVMWTASAISCWSH